MTPLSTAEPEADSRTIGLEEQDINSDPSQAPEESSSTGNSSLLSPQNSPGPRPKHHPRSSTITMSNPSFNLINPPSIHAPSPTYSHVQVTPISGSTGLVTIAGQVGIDAQTGTIPSSLGDQVQLALRNLGQCLASVGATPANLVSVTHYVVKLDPSDKSRANAFLAFMAGHRPPGTLVGVEALAEPRLLYEVQAVAVVSRGE